MTSKISLFSIMKEDIRHRLWMVALSFLGSFLALPILLLMILSKTVYTNTDYAFRMSQSVLHFFNENILLTCGFVGFLGALIVGLLGFSFLYSKKKVDLFHSIPVKRSRIFLAYYLDGILIWLFPYLINLFFAIIIGVLNLNDMTLLKILLVNAAKSSILIIFSFLIIYHFCLVCVMISGNFFNALMSTIILGLSVVGTYALIGIFCSTYFEYFWHLPSALLYDRIIWVSPLASVFPILNKVDSTFMTIASLILMIVNLILAWRLYLNRPSELAEQGIQNKRIQGFLRIIGTYFLTLCGATLGSFVNSYFSYNSPSKNTPWSIFGIILMSIIGWGILNVIFNMNFKSFLKNKMQFGITTCIALLTFLSISGDWFGYDQRLPDKDNIEGGSFYVYGYSDGVSQRGHYQGIRKPSDIQYTDVDAIYSMLTKLVDNKNGHEIYITLNLKNGSEFCRKYSVHAEDKELVRAIIEDESYKNANYPLVTGQLPTPKYISFNDISNKSSHTVNDEAIIKKLENAYREDFEEHYTLDELKNEPVVGTLSRMYDEYGMYPEEYIYSSYTHTIALLQELQPNMVFTVDDVNIDSITLEVHLGDYLPNEALYSYFELEGYPSFDEITDQSRTKREAEINRNADNSSAHVIPVKEQSAELITYKNIIANQESIQELLPYLYIGKHSPYNIFDDKYIQVGSINSSKDSYDCFVEKGKLPKKWVDALLEQ